VKPKTLSLNHHLQLATTLRAVRAGISQIYELIAGCRLTSRVGRKVYGLELRLRKLKNELEMVMLRDHPEMASSEIYSWANKRNIDPSQTSMDFDGH
jgi:hypothetical protein